jgi:hypothetical protein
MTEIRVVVFGNKASIHKVNTVNVEIWVANKMFIRLIDEPLINAIESLSKIEYADEKELSKVIIDLLKKALDKALELRI